MHALLTYIFAKAYSRCSAVCLRQLTYLCGSAVGWQLCYCMCRPPVVRLTWNADLGSHDFHPRTCHSERDAMTRKRKRRYNAAAMRIRQSVSTTYSNDHCKTMCLPRCVLLILHLSVCLSCLYLSRPIGCSIGCGTFLLQNFRLAILKERI